MNRYHASLVAVTSVAVACVFVGGGSVEETPPTPTVFNFRPTSAKYVSVSYRSVVRAGEGQTHSEETLLSYLLTTDVTQCDSAMSATFVVDTVTRATASNIQPHEIARATGATFVARLASTGRLTDFSARVTGSPLLLQLANQLGEFFPNVPLGGIRPGLTWIDSTEAPRDQDGALLMLRAVTNYTADDQWIHEDGRSTMTVGWQREYSISGTGEQFGQRFRLDGTGSASGRSSFSADGTYLGTAKSDELSGEILIESMGATIQLRQTQTDTVRILSR